MQEFVKVLSLPVIETRKFVNQSRDYFTTFLQTLGDFIAFFHSNVAGMASKIDLILFAGTNRSWMSAFRTVNVKVTCCTARQFIVLNDKFVIIVITKAFGGKDQF